MLLDKEDYRDAETRYNTGDTADWSAPGKDNNEDFMLFSEYVLGRETTSYGWGTVWSNMQVVATPAVPFRDTYTFADNKYLDRNLTQRWLMALHAGGIQERFGDFKAVDPNLIPVGMLSAFQNAKVAWDS